MGPTVCGSGVPAFSVGEDAGFPVPVPDGEEFAVGAEGERGDALGGFVRGVIRTFRGVFF